MLRQLHLLALPIAVSIAFYDAGFFVAANMFSLTGREVLLGVVAGASGGTCVLAAVLWTRARSFATCYANGAARNQVE
jgi:hypothetical protein